jgi:hypothetical protein
MSATAIEELTDLVLKLTKDVSDLRRRRNQTLMTGTVESLKGSRAQVRLADDGDDGPVLTPQLRQAAHTGNRGGGVSRFSRLGVGESVLVVSPNGEVGEMSAVIPWVDTEDDPAAGTAEEDGDVIQRGNARISVKDGSIRLSVGDASLELTEAMIRMLVERVENNGRNIGHSHTHPGIMPGAANTQTPNS